MKMKRHLASVLVAVTLPGLLVACSKPKAPAAPAPAPGAPTGAGFEELRASPGGIVLPDDLPYEIADQILRLPTQRAAVINALVPMAPKPDGVMERLLASDNIEEATGALEYFERTGGKGGAEASKLLDHPVPSIRRQALVTLMAVAASDRAPAIAKALDDPDSTVRTLAIRALAMLGGATAPQALIDKLDDPEEQVTVEVAVALGSTEDKSVGPKLLDKLGSARAATVLGALTALRLLEVAVPAEALTKALADGRLEVAMGAARAAALAGPQAPTVLAAALADARPEVRRVALESSAFLPVEAAVAAAKQAAEDPSPWVRAAAVELLAARLPEAERVRALVPLLHDDAREVRQATAIVLGKTNPEALRPLIGRLHSERDRMTRLVLVRALGQLKDPQAVEPLIAALEAREAQDHYMIGRALKAITGQAFGADAKAWRAWHAAHPGAEPAPAPAPAQTGG
jgi:HEAT repeat protein